MASRKMLAPALALAIAATLPQFAMGVVDSQRGADGAKGADAVAPGGAGSPGLNGEAATSQVITTDAINSATAIGGSGGAGGQGNDGPGGDGGAGGKAIAVAEGSAASTSVEGTANATGGSGAMGGLPGPMYYYDGGSYGASGAGGDAQARAVAQTLGEGLDAKSSATATGGAGAGFNTPRPGISMPPAVGGRGGNAEAYAESIVVGNGAAEAVASAWGGTGGRIEQVDGKAGEGGDAWASAFAANAGNAPVTVSASARGGSTIYYSVGTGVDGARAGNASLGLVRGESTGGGAVSVTAAQYGGVGGRPGAYGNGAPGSDTILENAISGSTTGALSLTQIAGGGGGGSVSHGGIAGRGGNAQSLLNLTDLTASSLSGTVVAIGGSGGYAESSNNGVGANGGNAMVSVDLVGRNDVTVSARAEGGVGGFSSYAPGEAGVPILGIVRGVSTEGGAVTVSAAAVAGNREGLHGTGSPVEGAPVTLENAVQGETTGALTLRQNAIGGAAGNYGQGGNASSTLSYSRSVSQLHLIAEATGGKSGLGITGGTGTAVSTAHNSAGPAVAETHAIGGLGGTSGGRGGEALSTASASTMGDGIAAEAFGYAVGGDGKGGTSGGPAFGGHASSSSNAFGVGNSSVRAIDSAIGGNGGNGSEAGSGGTALSSAFARNAGTADVVVSATARGGNGGNSSSTAGNGGNATGLVRGESTGGASVSVTATQIGGDGGILTSLPNGVSGSGADSFMHNAVSGSTSGNLTLTQIAVGGKRGGTYGNARHGDAASILELSDSQAALFTGHVQAFSDANATARVDLVGMRDVHAIATTTTPTTTAVTLSARGVSLGGGNVIASVARTVQSGASTLTNAVSGSTSGSLTLQQSAMSNQVATSSLDYVDAQAAVLNGEVVADGLGSSTASLKLGGQQAVNAHSIARTRAYYATATAEARALDGAESWSEAVCDRTGVLRRVHASANGMIPSGTDRSEARFAPVSTSVPSLTGYSSNSIVAHQVPGPNASMLLTPYSDVAEHFDNLRGLNPGPTTDAWVLATLAGSNTDVVGEQSHVASVSTTISLDDVATPTSLILGLLNPVSGTCDFDRLRFSVLLEGVSLIDRTFDQPDQAVLFFDDQSFNLADLSQLAPSGLVSILTTDQPQVTLDLTISIEVTTHLPGQGFGTRLIFGNASAMGEAVVPEPMAASWAIFAAMGWGLRRRRRPASID